MNKQTKVEKRTIYTYTPTEFLKKLGIKGKMHIVDYNILRDVVEIEVKEE